MRLSGGRRVDSDLGRKIDLPRAECPPPTQAYDTRVDVARGVGKGEIEQLDSRYRTIDHHMGLESEPRNTKFWTFGRVFKMLWTEPQIVPSKKDSSTTMYEGTGGSIVYTKIRRFVVVKTKSDSQLQSGVNDQESGLTHLDEDIYNLCECESQLDNRSPSNYSLNEAAVSSKYNGPHWKPPGDSLGPICSDGKYLAVVMQKNQCRFENDIWQEGKLQIAGNCPNCGRLYSFALDETQTTEHGMKRGLFDAIVALNTGSGIMMGSSYIWLNERMGLHKLSSIIERGITIAQHQIPTTLLEHLESVPKGIIFLGFVIATGMFTGTTFAWAVSGIQSRSGKASRNYSSCASHGASAVPFCALTGIATSATTASQKRN